MSLADYTINLHDAAREIGCTYSSLYYCVTTSKVEAAHLCNWMWAMRPEEVERLKLEGLPVRATRRHQG